MLIELSITNFAIIDQLRLALGPHFDVFTGETGAGKSILVDAISALVGERVGADVVRAGSERAIVEGIFDVSALLQPTDDDTTAQPARLTNGPSAGQPAGGDAPGTTSAASDADETFTTLLVELGALPEDGQLILTREMARSGRGIARVNGRAVPLSTLQRLGAHLIDIHGQSAHLALLRPEQHINYLDRYAHTEDLREQVARLVAEWRAARRELERLRRNEREIERRIELLRYQVDEITAAHLQPNELDDLERERRMLANAEHLGELCVAIHAMLAGDETGDETGDTPGALDALANGQRAFTDLLRLDDTLREASASLDQARYLLEDVAAAVRSYQEDVAADPQRLALVEERLDLIARLRRKYGATIEEILAFADTAFEDLDTLSHREERVSELQRRDGELRHEIGALSARLSQRRQVAGAALAQAMERELDELNMRRARFRVQMTHRPDPDGAFVTAEHLALAARNERTGATSDAQQGHGKQRKPAKPEQRVNGRRSAATSIASVAPEVSGAAPEPPAHVRGELEAGVEAGEPLTPGAYTFTATGIDQVEFLIAPNAGEPFKPLARIASGGETSRLMLALKTILSSADAVPILIFDEIDAGISGRSGQVVGEKLWRLGQAHQTLCVTHLPQIAALGDEHYDVSKALIGDRTATQVRLLTNGTRIEQLSQMLGGASTGASRANAQELLERADVWKAEWSIGQTTTPTNSTNHHTPTPNIMRTA
ncbi:MAG: DNA repair protein RecN [Ktedonobacterales bacterium]